MLISWTGALVNGGNVFPSIKDSKLRVLTALLTIDFAWRAASQVHYMGISVPAVGSRAIAQTTGRLGVRIALLFRTTKKNCFNQLLFCIRWLQSRLDAIRMTPVPGVFFFSPQLIHILNEHRKKRDHFMFFRELSCNCWGFLSHASHGETVFLLVAF